MQRTSGTCYTGRLSLAAVLRWSATVFEDFGGEQGRGRQTADRRFLRSTACDANHHRMLTGGEPPCGNLAYAGQWLESPEAK